MWGVASNGEGKHENREAETGREGKREHVLPFAALMDSNRTRDCPYRALLYTNSVPSPSAQRKDLNASLLSPDKRREEVCRFTRCSAQAPTDGRQLGSITGVHVPPLSPPSLLPLNRWDAPAGGR